MLEQWVVGWLETLNRASVCRLKATLLYGG